MRKTHLTDRTFTAKPEPTSALQQPQQDGDDARCRAEVARLINGLLSATVPDCAPADCSNLLCRRTQLCQAWRRNIQIYHAGRPLTENIKTVRAVLLRAARAITIAAMSGDQS